MSRAHHLLREGENLADAEAWPEALRKFEEALALFRESGADEDVAGTLYDISRLPEETVDYKSRLAAARNSAAMFRRLGKLGDTAKALDHVACIQYEKSKALGKTGRWLAWWLRKSANRTRKKAADLYEQAGMALESARTMFNLGREIQTYEHENTAALKLYAAVEPVLRRLGDDHDMAVLLFLQGLAILFERGGSIEVVRLLRKALGLFQELGDRHGTELA